MNQGMMMNTVVSAIVGGVIGAGVVFFGASKGTSGDLTDLAVKYLKVANLVITEQAALHNKDGKEEVVLKEGSVLVENVILGKKIIARQVQGHAIVANRVFTTPDDLIATPMENWRFFAEIGSSIEAGGEIVVRSASGAAAVNRGTNGGILSRWGYDPEGNPQILALQNADRSQVKFSWELSDQQKRMLNAAAPGGAVQGFNNDSPMPMTGAVPPPDGNTMR